MHELSVCQALVAQVVSIAQEHSAHAVTAIRLRIGPLSGVEPDLLERAYPLAAADTVAARARLDIEAAPVRVACTVCGAESEARPNALACRHCGAWRTRLIAGDEMLLASVELETQASDVEC